jgi:hypothetical protein
MTNLSDNLFLAEGPAPGPEAIAAALGEGYPLYETVLAAAPDFEREWKHYGKKYGWKLKVHDGAKALFELTVCAGALRISVAARESEMEALRQDPEMAAILAELAPPGKAREGWGIRLSVVDAESCGRAALVIRKVREIRLQG